MCENQNFCEKYQCDSFWRVGSQMSELKWIASIQKKRSNHTRGWHWRVPCWGDPQQLTGCQNPMTHKQRCFISSIPELRGSLGHHRWFCNQLTSFPHFFPVLHCPPGLGKLQVCPFPGIQCRTQQDGAHILGRNCHAESSKQTDIFFLKTMNNEKQLSCNA